MKARKLVLAIALCLLVKTALGQPRMGIIEIGEPLPRLELPLLGSDRLVTTDNLFRGKKTILLVFASW